MTNKQLKEKIWEVDSEYIQYQISHYPEAIEFIRKNVKNFEAEGIVKNKNDVWIDIQKFDTFSNRAPNGRILKGTENIILFREIEFDIFPRKIIPVYVQPFNAYERENRYITWKTATEDIEKQKMEGCKGERWHLKCEIKTFAEKRTVVIPKKEKYVMNPEYYTYYDSPAYLRYQDDCGKYTMNCKAYRTFRTSFHDFTLPDGTVKSVLLYNRLEEKFDKLRALGVSESEIQKYRNILANEPVRPLPPQRPPEFIPKVIPAHKKQTTEWKYEHTIKSVQKRIS